MWFEMGYLRLQSITLHRCSAVMPKRLARMSGCTPGGFELFAFLLCHGPIVCSSIFPAGYILIISKVAGERLDIQWARISVTEKLHVKWNIRKAVNGLKFELCLPRRRKTQCSLRSSRRQCHHDKF